MKSHASALIIALLILVLISSSAVIQARAESFEATWTGYIFFDDDTFYKETVVAYEAGSTAVLYVSLTHDNTSYAGKQLNVSAVGVSFNWGDTFNSTQANKTSPVTLKWKETRIFTITFEVPSVKNVSNLFRWDYKIFIEHVNATGAVVDTEIKTREDLKLPYFVVYSSDQARYRRIANTISGISPLKWNSTKAKILWARANNETNVAKSYYTLGEFSKAAAHYENALDLINQAFKAEESTGTRWEDAQIALLEAQAKQLGGWTNFLNGLSNMWTLIGIALVLFALGYIIRGFGALRRATAPP
jgi:tetratricopeptide (TPR) repeat protein